ncbi:hypothetical protein MMC30_007881 [Trapelia coarctata]|nr:hypothetical protein [Trapelia coarctata]
MPQISLYPPSPSRSSPHPSPLPSLLKTPAGLAILELQGTINVPPPSESSPSTSTLVGRLVFPNYDPTKEGDKKWMKKVYFYVGKHQRLTGEVKELSKPLGVVRRRVRKEGEGQKEGGVEELKGSGEDDQDELEVVEVVRWKMIFSNRPEPVGGMGE